MNASVMKYADGTCWGQVSAHPMTWNRRREIILRKQVSLRGTCHRKRLGPHVVLTDLMSAWADHQRLEADKLGPLPVVILDHLNHGRRQIVPHIDRKRFLTRHAGKTTSSFKFCYASRGGKISGEKTREAKSRLAVWSTTPFQHLIHAIHDSIFY